MSYSKIGIIGAMESEVIKLYSQMTDREEIKLKAWTFYTGRLSGTDVVIVRSGIGKVNMAACTQALIDEFDVDCVMNTGIAGSLESKIDIGDIVISDDCIQHDMDAVAFGYKLGVIPQMKCSTFKADDELKKLAVETCKKVNPDINVFTGRVLSGDVFVADQAKKDFLVSEFAGTCTEMEGAAMAQVAYMNKLPFVVIRAISDKADNSAKVDYPTFEKKAIEHMVNLVVNFVAALN